MKSNDIANKSEGFSLHPHCPFEFCKTGEELIFSIQNIDFQCSSNRFGFLCGACTSVSHWESRAVRNVQMPTLLYS